MINDQSILDTSQAITESDFPIEISKVQFQRDWVFWENYQNRDGKTPSWEDSIKQIISFSDLLTFWQFWNNYYCNKPNNMFFDGDRFVYFFKDKKRIDGLNLFLKGITPKWEDVNNNGGRILNVLYDIKEDHDQFLSEIEKVWLDLVLMLLGESLPASKHINGIRFIDKCKHRQKALYRIELWLNPTINANLSEIEQLKDFLKSKCESEVEDKPITTQ